MEQTRLIDDFSDTRSAITALPWRYFSDRVMGGISEGSAERVTVDGRSALHLSGSVSLENNGGFIQAALDLQALTDTGRTLDASAFNGLAITMKGDGRDYALHLRTTDLRRPWESYRHRFASAPDWQTVQLPFADFKRHRVERPLDLRRLRRLGIVAIGAAGEVSLFVDKLEFYT